MHTIEIPAASFVSRFPSELDEMTFDQFQYYIQQVFLYHEGSITVDRFKANLIKNFLGIESSIRYGLMKPEKKDEIDSNIARLGELMDSFIEELEQDGKPIQAFKLKTTRNFAPRMLNYWGPKDGFSNVNFCEYRIARNHFRQYAESGDQVHLNRLLAVLYRPARSFTCLRRKLSSWDGEVRIGFTSSSNPELIELRARRIARLPFHIRYCGFLYFAGCEDFLKSGKPVIDGIEIDFSNLYSESASEDQSNIGMTGLLFSMAESGVFGSIEQTDNQNIWDVMTRVYQVVMQAKEFERKNKIDGSGS